MHTDSVKPDYIQVGKLLKAHGIKGEIKLLPFSGVPGDLLGIADFELRQGHETRIVHAIKLRCQGRYLVAKFDGVDGRNVAESLVGCEVWLPKDVLPELAPDEFYWHEMEGVEVVTVEGRTLGRVTSLMATGAHDILVIKGTGREYLIPVIKEIIVKFDEQNGVLVVDPPPGLLEINEPDAV